MSDLFSVAGRRALITGGAQGLGRQIARGLVKAGARVYLTSRDPKSCASAAEALTELGDCFALTADVGTAEGARDLAVLYAEREPRLDILVNNAGRTWGAPLETFPDHAWSRVMALNVQAPFTLVRDLLPLLKAGASREEPSRVLNIGSVAGSVVEPLQAYSYAASKAAIHHLSRVLAAELAVHHINVNVIAPGYFPTQMTAHIHGDERATQRLIERIPAGRLGQADDIVGACIFLSSRAGSYVTGAELCVDGGMSGCR